MVTQVQNLFVWQDVVVKATAVEAMTADRLLDRSGEAEPVVLTEYSRR